MLKELLLVVMTAALSVNSARAAIVDVTTPAGVGEDEPGLIDPVLITLTEDGSSIHMTYDPINEIVIFNVKVKIGTYIALGFGSDMIQTEMIQWAAQSAYYSYFATWYSVGHNTPLDQPDLMPCYTYEKYVDKTDNTFVQYSTSRPLECNITDTYALQLNQMTSLITAWNPENYQMSFHYQYRESLTVVIDEDGLVTLTEQAEAEDRAYRVHGIIMYSTWSCISLLQIALNRYLRHFWRWKQLAHSLIGILALICTLTGAILSWMQDGTEIEENPHKQLAYISLGCIGFFASMGLVSYILRSQCLCFSMDWKTPWIIRITKLHKYCAYITIVFSQATVSSGIMNYFTYNGEKKRGYELIILTNLLFYTIWIVAEVFYRIRNRKEVEIMTDDDDLQNITKVEFYDMIHEQGRQLVILDEYILDVSEFMHKHPGGRFALKHNIGRDISKYFYGGYSLDGNIDRKNPRPGVVHSNIARSIANSLIIAYYEKEVDKTSTICRLKEDKIYVVNDIIKTFFMENVTKKPVPNFKRHYHGFEVLTKHFWIRTLQDRSVIRHYTICNAMDPKLYAAYVLSLDADSGRDFDRSLLDMSDQSQMLFNVKNYQTSKGLSKKLHTLPQRSLLYEVKGPMGKGLQVQSTGVHIAFAAGTGVLCFVDLVGHLIQANLGLIEAPFMVDLERFKFIFYVSFASEADNIALELLEAFDQYCQRNGKLNFDLYVRLKKENKNARRWDRDFVVDEMRKQNMAEIQRIWVCGPPKMNEIFDQALSSLDEEGMHLEPH